MNKRFKRARAFILDNWHVAVIFAVGIGVIISLLFVQLGSLVGGLSANEFEIQQRLSKDALSFTEVIKEPLFLPYNLAVYFAQFLPFSGPTTIRSVSALFGLLGALGFFYILNKWYSLRIAIIGTVLFASSSWFLHTARYASPDASYLLLPLLVAGIIGLQAKTRSKWIALTVILFGCMALYIPGLVWFIVPAILLQRRVIARSIKLQRLWFNVLAGILCLVMLIPLVYGLFTSQSPANLLLGLAGFPNSIPSIGAVAAGFIESLGNIFIYSSHGQLYGPGHLPWLDLCSVILVLLGSVQFAQYYKLDRSKLFLLIVLGGLILTAIGGSVSLAILLPFVYLLAVEGLRWLLDVWLQVFPRNPIARGTGIAIIVLMTISISFYQTNKYFLAWGQAPETQAQFDKLP